MSSKNRRLEYRIYRLELSKMLKFFFLEQNKDERIPTYSQQSFNRCKVSIVDRDNTQNDCSLFYQFLLEVNKEHGGLKKVNEILELASKTDGVVKDLSKRIVYVSFGSVLTDIDQCNDTYKKRIITSLLDPINGGFAVNFEDEHGNIERVRYVSFFKSNSMSKKGILSFIDEKYYQKMIDRSLLDLNIKEDNLSLSRFYAYSGLSMSSGIRIDTDKSVKGLGKLTLNENTVVVVDDFTKDPKYLRVRPLITIATKKVLVNVIKNALILKYYLTIHSKDPKDLSLLDSINYSDQNFNLLVKRILGRKYLKNSKPKNPEHKLDKYKYHREFYNKKVLKDIVTILNSFGVKSLAKDQDLNESNVNLVIEKFVEERSGQTFFQNDGTFKNIAGTVEEVIDTLTSYKENIKDSPIKIEKNSIGSVVTLHSLNESKDCFDGEGLISLKYSNILNEFYTDEKYLKDDIKHKSFQFRLPLMKGVLHTVDFKSFYEEECMQRFFVDVDNNEEVIFDEKKEIYLSKSEKEIKGIIKNGEKYILDIFGKYRRLKDIEIIITKGQFKYEKITSQSNEYIYDNDFMMTYFKIFKRYNHSFYITNSDSLKESEGDYTRLNYQFLSTAGLTKDDVEKIIEIQKNKIIQLSSGSYNEISKLFDLFKEDVIDDINEESESFEEKFSSKNTSNNYINDDSYELNIGESNVEKETYSKYHALALNENLKYSNAVMNIVENAINKEISEILVGHILFKGELRYLSGDLLLLLYTILGANISDIDPKERLRENDFYAPGGRFFKYVNGQLKPVTCVLQRNPHISKNENVVSKSWIPFECSLREKYFSNLKFVCMIDASSLIQERLGGADYDGDEVRIISDPNFVNTVIQSKYETKPYFVEDAEFGYKVNKYETAIVPSITKDVSSHFSSGEDIYFTLFNTFGNAIGHYSNDGFKAACVAYTKQHQSNEAHISKVVEYYLTVGLEIDSAKSGIKPKCPKQLVKKEDPIFVSASSFLDIKNHYSTETTAKEKCLENYISNSCNAVLCLNEAALNIKNNNKIYKKDKLVLKSAISDLPELNKDLTNIIKELVRVYKKLTKTQKMWIKYVDKNILDLIYKILIQNFQSYYGDVYKLIFEFVVSYLDRIKDKEIDFYSLAIMSDEETKEEIIKLFELNEVEIEEYIDAIEILSMHHNSMAKLINLVITCCKLSLQSKKKNEEVTIFTYQEAEDFHNDLKQAIAKYYHKNVYVRSEHKDHLLKEVLKQHINALFGGNNLDAMKYIFLLDAHYKDVIPDWLLWDLYNEELLAEIKKGVK